MLMNKRRRALMFLAVIAFAPLLPACTGEPGPTLSAAEAYAQASAGQLTIVDIRTPEEWRQTGVGQNVARVDMRRPDFVQQLEVLAKHDRNAPIALICRTGNRTTRVQQVLMAEGFTNIFNIQEGMAGSAAGQGWIRQGLPLVSCGSC